jgi:hypothetical protein
MPNPISSLHRALSAAIYRDLPDIEYYDRDWTKWRALSKQEQIEAIKNNTPPEIKKSRRPRDEDVEVFMFHQTWGSTTLGYGGVGGSAITTAYTVVISLHGAACVYFGGDRLAYRLDFNELSAEGRKRFNDDIRSHDMADCRECVRYK